MREIRTDPGRPGRPGPAFVGLTLLAAIVLLALAGCGPAPDAVADQLVEAINSRDLSAALRLFAADAVVSLDRPAPFSGQRELQAWLEDLFADNVTLDRLEVLAQDDNHFQARYSLAMDSARALGVETLEGTAEMVIREDRITALSFRLSKESRASLLWASLRMGGPVLSYAVLTDPDPLRASPGGGYYPNLASLTVLVTNDTANPVTVRSIGFYLPQGSGARDLTPNISGVNSEAPDLWHITKKEGWFTLAPELAKDGVLESGAGLYITLSEIEINDEPGVWGLEIVEETDEAAQGSQVVSLVKFPFALYVSDLAAEPLIVEPGGSTLLSWEGSDGATYYLYDGGETFEVSSEGSYDVEPLTQTTTFYLTATLVGAEDLLPVVRERTVTVKPSR